MASSPAAPAPRRTGLLYALGLHRPELRAWAMYDWAISSMQTVITTAVFPIFFIRVAGAGLSAPQATEQYSWANTIAAVLIAHVAGKESGTTALGAQIYFWGRVAYVPLYAFGVRQVRSLVWLGSTAGLLMIFWALLAG